MGFITLIIRSLPVKNHQSQSFTLSQGEKELVKLISDIILSVNKIKLRFLNTGKGRRKFLSNILLVTVEFIEQFSNGCPPFGIRVVLMDAFFVCLFYRNN